MKLIDARALFSVPRPVKPASRSLLTHCWACTHDLELHYLDNCGLCEKCDCVLMGKGPNGLPQILGGHELRMLPLDDKTLQCKRCDGNSSLAWWIDAADKGEVPPCTARCARCGGTAGEHETPTKPGNCTWIPF